MVRSPYVFALSVLAACGRADTAARPDLVSAAAHAVGRTRNVVVFLVDTLRADHLGCYGYERDTSPNVDALAAEGILFEECLAQSSWTKPATASVLTGEYPARHGATSVHAKLGDLETLAGFVSAHGMSTAAFVANGWINPDMGFARGFDVFELRQRRPCEELVGEALDWVAERGEEPFFLYVHVIDPHDPYDPPPAFRIFCRDYDGPVTGYEEGESLRRLRDEDLDHLIALYDGEIAYVDDQFGRFVRGLEALGRDEDTAIVFLADHGEAFRDHDSWRHNPLLFREVVRVPLILRVPGAPTLRGLRRDSLAGQIDVAPTVLELLGIQPETRLPGTSLLELVKDPRSREGAYLLTEVDLGANRKAVVGRGMKYVREFAPTEQEFLYDLREDPGELQDLLPAGRGAAEHHAEFLSAFASSTSAGFSILVQNGEETPMEVEVYLASREGPLPHVRIFNAEWGAEESRDGPLALYEVDVSGLSLHVARARLFVEPDDSDGVLLDHPDEAAVLVAVRVRGAWVPPERYLLGPSIPAREVPILLRSDLTTYDAPRFPPREDLGAEPYRIRVWRNLSARTDDGTMSAETLAALEAMGYLGGEE